MFRAGNIWNLSPHVMPTTCMVAVGLGSASAFADVRLSATSSDAETTFTITAKNNGYHAIRLRYAAGPN